MLNEANPVDIKKGISISHTPMSTCFTQLVTAGMIRVTVNAYADTLLSIHALELTSLYSNVFS